MAEQTLKPRTAFEGLAVPGRYGAVVGTEPQVLISECLDRTVAQLAVFHGKGEAMEEAVRSAAALHLPRGPKRAAANGVTLIGIAPTQWLAIAEGQQGRALLMRLSDALRDLAAVVDQSDAKAMLRLSGPRARDVLAKGCSLDLHPSVFTTSDAATTQAALMPLQLWLVDETPTFELSVPLSYARSFWSWLTASAAEFGYDVAGAERN